MSDAAHGLLSFGKQIGMDAADAIRSSLGCMLHAHEIGYEKDSILGEWSTGPSCTTD